MNAFQKILIVLFASAVQGFTNPKNLKSSPIFQCKDSPNSNVNQLDTRYRRHSLSQIHYSSDDEELGDDASWSLQSYQKSSGRRVQKEEEEFTPPSTTFGSEEVPENQRPTNEYMELLTQPLFDWAQAGDSGLGLRLLGVYIFFFAAVCYPISGATFTQDGYILQKLTSSNIGALMIVNILLIRFLSGWDYIGSRLKSKNIQYEETGWYDGQTIQKSEQEIARDLFLYRQDVQPVEERLKKFTAAGAVFFVISCVGFSKALDAKPVFNEYNPALLERLVFDEKAADVAAQQSFGRPTYCDSRYYRAVAGGGQGCN